MKSFDPFHLDVANQALWHGDERVPLMPKPFAVLQHLVERPGRLVTPEQLLRAIWGDTHVQADVLRRYIMEIRRALGDDAKAPRFIETLPKRGFRFIADVADESAAAAAAGSGATRLVGRVAALADLDARLNAALSKRRQVVFIIGEPGIGKTSLVDSLQHQAASRPPMRVARGHCVEGFASKEPYYPVLEALGQLVRANAGSAIVEALATHAPTWMIQFRSLVRDDQRTALQREMLGATRERMVRELCEALELVTQTIPLLLVLEDLHWADHSTLDLVSALARRRAPAGLLLVGTYRPGEVIVSRSPLKELSHDLNLHRLSHEIVLDRLSESDIQDYLTPLFLPGELPQGLAAIIHKHSDGNPLFMTAMLDHLESQGALRRTERGLALAVALDDLDPGVPDTLRRMLEMQLERLHESDRRLLECASVAGPHPTAWAIAAMLQGEAAQVEQQCQALADSQQFLTYTGSRTLPGGLPTLEYRFKHALYQELLYRHLSSIDRVAFHRRLGNELERLHSPVQPEIAAEVALHLEEGRAYERAAHHLLLAAENATKRHAYPESIGFLEHALALLSEIGPETRAPLESRILERIGDAQYTVGDVERSVQTYDDMASKARQSGLASAEARALMRLAHPAAFVESARSIAGCERAAEIGAAIGDATLEIKGRFLASCWRIMNEGWRPADAESCARAIVILRQLGAELPPYDQILYARVQIFQAQYADAVARADQALQQLSEAHGLWVRAKALSTKATALLFWGHLGDAHRTVSTGIALAKRNESAPWLGILLSTLAWLRWEAHDFAGIDALSEKVDEFARAATSARMWLRATANVAGATMGNLQGFADLAAGRHDRALQRFSEAATRPPRPKFGLSWQRRMFAQLGLSETWLATGELTRATAEADALVADALECGDAYLKARVLEMRARLALTAGKQETAERYVRHALETVTTFALPLAAWRVHRTAWDVLRQTHNPDADVHRAHAERAIRALADSLAGIDPLQQTFLSAAPIRRVLEARSDDPNESLAAGVVQPF